MLKFRCMLFSISCSIVLTIKMTVHMSCTHLPERFAALSQILLYVNMTNNVSTEQ